MQPEEELYPYQDETYIIIGLGMKVHRQLGKGFSEIVYKDAFEYEFKKNKVPFEREKEYSVCHEDIILPHKFYADFVVFDKVILEIKSKRKIIEDHYSQVLNYFAISKLKVGILLNFHENSLEYKRIVLTK